MEPFLGHPGDLRMLPFPPEASIGSSRNATWNTKTTEAQLPATQSSQKGMHLPHVIIQTSDPLKVVGVHDQQAFNWT